MLWESKSNCISLWMLLGAVFEQQQYHVSAKSICAWYQIGYCGTSTETLSGNVFWCMAVSAVFWSILLYKNKTTERTVSMLWSRELGGQLGGLLCFDMRCDWTAKDQPDDLMVHLVMLASGAGLNSDPWMQGKFHRNHRFHTHHQC